MEVWQKASSKGLAKLLNLVFDEHLERNLRAMDETFGNKLEQLGTYAFNRSAKDFYFGNVLAVTRSRTLEIFVDNPPAVAREPDCLRVRGGTLLLGLERLCQDTLCSDPNGDVSVFGEGIANSDIQKEIERITSPPAKDRRPGSTRLCVNVSEEGLFDLINNVRRLP